MSLATAAVVSPDVAGGAPRRPRTPKVTSRPCDPRPKKVSVYLSESAVRKLDIHVAMDGGDRSRLVEHLIQESLKRRCPAGDPRRPCRLVKSAVTRPTEERFPPDPANRCGSCRSCGDPGACRTVRPGSLALSRAGQGGGWRPPGLWVRLHSRPTPGLKTSSRIARRRARRARPTRAWPTSQARRSIRSAPRSWARHQPGQATRVAWDGQGRGDSQGGTSEPRRPATSVDPARHRSPGPRPRGGSMRGNRRALWP